VKSPLANIRVRGLSIDTRSCKVLVADSEVTLGAKEFELLLFVAPNPAQGFIYEQLFDRIWGEETHGDVGIVNIHVCRVREGLSASLLNRSTLSPSGGIIPLNVEAFRLSRRLVGKASADTFSAEYRNGLQMMLRHQLLGLIRGSVSERMGDLIVFQ